ncbi:MAG: pyruvate, phosphate dikinase [Candidatus Latescibacteria bacterium]|nr:pyruvate, phosphate dikinase [Candidatus Latescibacterota bacterium]
MAKKFVYSFGAGQAEGRADMKNLLGGKGANLAEMSNLGIPVPAGFTLSTEVCTAFYENDRQYPEGLKEQVEDALSKVEAAMESKFGDSKNPLLVSVRSGARVSMPGMMDTVLNLGLNDTTVQGLIAQSGDERFAYDCYRRFVQMYGDVVLGLKPVEKDELDPFEVIIDKKKEAKGVELDTALDADDLKALVGEFKAAIKQKLGMDFPEDPMEQLWGAIGAVFDSWNTDRAIAYREMNNIPEHWGTAVNVQAMVFGNMGAASGTGVAFTRDPATGENVFYGEYLMNAQGEDVVAGIRTPQPVNLAQKRKTGTKLISLEEEMPEIYAQLEETAKRLDTHYRDMNDLEFTIQKGKLWMLQTRIGKRTGFAAFKMAVDMEREGLITKEEALMRVDPEQLNQLLRPVFDPGEKAKAMSEGKVLAKGLNAGPGAATGRAVFNAPDAEAWADRGEDVILVRIETSPEDIRGMNAAKGILTARGGMTSHAALVARQMGKVCVAGCGELVIDYGKRQMAVGDQVIKEGDYISLDGTTGEVMAGEVKTMPSEVLQVIDGQLKPEGSQIYQDYADLLSWADEVRKLGVRANADQPDQAKTAVAFGAEGIGLCRTEHMFFEEDRIDSVREMILSDEKADREKALAKLLPMQREDFAGLFRAMDGFPVIIRTLDPPLHEFLPHGAKGIAELAKKIGAPAEKLQAKADSLREANPMLGHRGCRLGIVYPEITEMQARAIFEAACEVAKEGITVIPEVMIPLVGHVNELKAQKELVDRVAKEVIVSYGVDLEYMIGTMIELPRAALTADKIAEEAEFFSYGTNDLTQTTFGLSRDDAKFLPDYLAAEIWEKDPFQTIDQDGVGALIRIGVEKGRSTRSDLEVGICGEHGGDPASVEFCHRVGMDYVSCSPFRVPIARLAAAQAVLKEK